MLYRNKTIKSIFAATALLLPASLVAASGHGPAMQLKTSTEEVIGVREIEKGNYQDGIRKTQAALNLTTVSSQRAPLVNNLCVAHIALDNLSDAEQFCNESVNSNKAKTIALSNRAVFHFLNGDFEASRNDLMNAAKGTQYQALIVHNQKVLEQQALLAKK